MKKTFTLQEAIDIATTEPACYTTEQVEDVYGSNTSMTITEIMNSDISITDKAWFLYNGTQLTASQKTEIQPYLSTSEVAGGLEDTLVETLINYINSNP